MPYLLRFIIRDNAISRYFSRVTAECYFQHFSAFFFLNNASLTIICAMGLKSALFYLNIERKHFGAAFVFSSSIFISFIVFI